MSFRTNHDAIGLQGAYWTLLSQKCNSLHKVKRNNPMINMITIQCFCHQIKSPTVFVKKEEIGICCFLFTVTWYKSTSCCSCCCCLHSISIDFQIQLVLPMHPFDYVYALIVCNKWVNSTYMENCSINPIYFVQIVFYSYSHFTFNEKNRRNAWR